MTALIDIDLLHEQLDGLPPAVLDQICAAFAADMARESAALLAAVAADDADAVRRARHSLDGLCGNFGAGRVMALARGPLHDPAGRTALQEAVARTVAAVHAEISQ